MENYFRPAKDFKDELIRMNGCWRNKTKQPDQLGLYVFALLIDMASFRPRNTTLKYQQSDLALIKLSGCSRSFKESLFMWIGCWLDLKINRVGRVG